MRSEKPSPKLRYCSSTPPNNWNVSGASSGRPSLSRSLPRAFANGRSNHDSVTPTSQSRSRFGERCASAARLLLNPATPSAMPT
ncbi:MAG TPA: hypothetical protein VK458_12955 [Myxococcaceae bacterium]|nr:hypothetical protein [Myxococcaceae bacterium]